MSAFKIHRDLMRFVVLKDNAVAWTSEFSPTPSGFGFLASDSKNSKYELVSSGILFWRRLSLVRNGAEIDQIGIYKSVQTGISLRRHKHIFINGKEEFSIVNHGEASKFGNLTMSWEYPASQYEPTIYTLLLACHQGRGQTFGV
jgi:hypothetical protein